MRIIAGTYRSRPLEAPRGMKTRPTSDRLRETLFNVLAPRIEGAAFADLYAGSGAVGIEALSRGAASVIFVERAAAAVEALRGNFHKLGISSGFRVHPKSVRGFLSGDGRAGREAELLNIVFLDPPYDAEEEYAATLGLLGGGAADRLAEGAVVIAEHRAKFQLNDAYGGLRRTRLLKQGDAALSFYRAVAEPTAERIPAGA